MLAGERYTQQGHQRDAANQCDKRHPVRHRGHRVAMKTMANSEAIAVRLQKTCMAQRQCRQKSSIQAMTIPALPTMT
jgi:hypothetical protein